TTDVAAYFTGRTLGGPKLMPSVSPKKTWSGALGGLLAATLAGTAVVAYGRAGAADLAGIPLIAAGLASAAA
ncbi:phosphatidate cytidylyltransferase, partial [Stenotrophomonas maltophilia]